MPDESPALWKTDCENCHKTYWMYASRIEECIAYPDRKAVEADFEVNHETKKFERRKTTDETGLVAG